VKLKVVNGCSECPFFEHDLDEIVSRDGELGSESCWCGYTRIMGPVDSEYKTLDPFEKYVHLVQDDHDYTLIENVRAEDCPLIDDSVILIGAPREKTS
jgi:hypothetical protein